MEYITTANVLVWVFSILALFMMFLSYWLTATALFPAMVERCAQHYARPMRCALVGLFAGLIPIALGLVVLKVFPPALKWIGVLMIAVPIFAGLLGSAGLAHRIGSGLRSPMDESQPWRASLRGGTVLSLTFLLPILGQLLLIPLTLASGIGAWIFSLKRRVETAPTIVTPPALPS